MAGTVPGRHGCFLANLAEIAVVEIISKASGAFQTMRKVLDARLPAECSLTRTPRASQVNTRITYPSLNQSKQLNSFVHRHLRMHIDQYNGFALHSQAAAISIWLLRQFGCQSYSASVESQAQLQDVTLMCSGNYSEFHGFPCPPSCTPQHADSNQVCKKCCFERVKDSSPDIKSHMLRCTM